MRHYSAQIEQRMRKFFGTLSEKDRRRYAAIEAEKRGHGGTQYVADLLGIDAKTIRQGRADLDESSDRAAGRVRKKGADANEPST